MSKLKTYKTQLFTNGLWRDELDIEARAGYLAAEIAMKKHVMGDPSMCGSEWTIRVELEYVSGKKYWDKSRFEPELVLHDVEL
jgi:hypothetical protein